MRTDSQLTRRTNSASVKDEVALALVCFADKKGASTAQQAFEERLRSNGVKVLQTTILQVNGKGKASVHDPRRVLAGTLTPALTWGLFGLIAGSNKLESTIVWAVIGAICGGAYAYLFEHALTKQQLAGIGRSLARNSSGLVTYAKTRDPARILAAAAHYKPSAASVAVIDDDLVPRVLNGATEPGGGESVLSMLLYSYPDPKAAAHIAKEAARGKHADGTPEIELVFETDRNGHRHVSDPTSGTAAWARSDVVSWGLFGIVFGAIAGAVGGGGFHGAVTEGVVTGVAWAVFGAFAGALYGLWAGRSISARRLEGVGTLLRPSTSALLAWASEPVRPSANDPFAAPGSKQLVLLFNPVAGGAVLEAPSSPGIAAKPRATDA